MFILPSRVNSLLARCKSLIVKLINRCRKVFSFIPRPFNKFKIKIPRIKLVFPNFSLLQVFAILVFKLLMLVIWIVDLVSISKIKFVQIFSYTLLFSFFLLFSGYFVYYSSYFKQLSSSIYSFNDRYVDFMDKELVESKKIPEFPVLVKRMNFEQAPELSAISAIVVDNKRSEILYEFNSDFKSAPASTTKLMTAVVAVSTYSLDDVISVPAVCAQVEGSKAYLPISKSFKVSDLLHALLINSSADAACTLSMGKISYKDFIEHMKKKKKSFGMTDTNFTNTIGLDGVNGSHYSTAYDLYLLSKNAMKSQVIRDIVKLKEYSFYSTDGAFYTRLLNTNSLLWEIPESIGVKTGTTVAAGEVLIYEYATDSVDVTIVVTGSADRFRDTRNLLNWILPEVKK